jgi:hypothetical protein
MSTDDDKARIKELESQIAELKAAMIILQRRVDPPPRPAEPARLEGIPASTLNIIDRMSVPQHILREMQQCIPDDVVRDIVKDGRR